MIYSSGDDSIIPFWHNYNMIKTAYRVMSKTPISIGVLHGRANGVVIRHKAVNVAWTRRVCYLSLTTRQLRHNVKGGWYHIIARGMGAAMQVFLRKFTLHYN